MDNGIVTRACEPTRAWEVREKRNGKTDSREVGAPTVDENAPRWCDVARYGAQSLEARVCSSEPEGPA